MYAIVVDVEARVDANIREFSRVYVKAASGKFATVVFERARTCRRITRRAQPQTVGVLAPCKRTAEKYSTENKCLTVPNPGDF